MPELVPYTASDHWLDDVADAVYAARDAHHEVARCAAVALYHGVCPTLVADELGMSLANMYRRIAEAERAGVSIPRRRRRRWF